MELAQRGTTSVDDKKQLNAGLIVASIALAILVVACGGTGSSLPQASLVPTSATASAAPSPTPTNENTFHVGDKVETALGNFFTVHQVIVPYQQTGEFTFPASPGFEWAIVDVEACAGSHPAPNLTINPFQVAIQMMDNTRVQPGAPVMEPALNNTVLAGPGDCVRGWISYQVPSSVAIRYVVDSYTTPIIRWAP